MNLVCAPSSLRLRSSSETKEAGLVDPVQPQGAL